MRKNRILYELAIKHDTMKLGFAMLVLLGVFAITLSIHDAYAQTDNLDRNYLHYQNDDIGMNLEYPDDWNLMETSRPDLPFVIRIWAPGNTGLISMDHIYRDTNLSPQEIAASQVKMLEIKGHGLKIIESKSLFVSNHPAWQLTYSTGDNAGHRLVESKVYITNDNSQYVFSYSVWDGFPDYLPVFDSMIDSVQINSVDVKVSSENSSKTSSAFFYVIPDWMEHNARWWNEGQIDDQTMISAIEFLAEHDIVAMPSEKEIDVYKISQSHYSDYEVYDMIKHNAWYWAEHDLGDEYLLKGIAYLASINSQEELSNESRNPDSCPQSFSSRCITGTVTEIFDGNTVRVDNALFRLALVSSPDLDEDGGQEAKEFLEQICSIGSDALVDQDDLRPLEGLSGTGRILAVIYCDGVNLNEMLVEYEFAFFDDTYCYASEFADESWAREGCSEKNPSLISSEDNFDIPEVKLFLEKYPQAEIQSDRINESGFHFKQYTARDTLPGGSVWLFLVKNLETGDLDNVISCPPNQNHDRGYIVRGSENIIEYLQNYDCLLDSDVGRFGPANLSFVKVK